MKRTILAVLIFLSGCVPLVAQTWVPLADQYRTYTTSVPITIRVGYPNASGGVWVTAKITVVAPATFNLPDFSSLGTGTAEVDVQQTATTITAANMWYDGSTGCYATATWTIPITGTVPAPTYPSNPCGITTPPVITPPVITPPVTTPPTTAPITVLTVQGTVSVDASGNITITFPAGSAITTGTCAIGNAGTYSLAICSGLPVLQTGVSPNP
jgi:hypothetical protein